MTVSICLEVIWKSKCRRFLWAAQERPHNLRVSNPLYVYSDYREDSVRDRYDLANIDDEDYDTLDPSDRAAVEQRLNRRDAEIMRREGRMADAFMDGIDDDIDNPVPTRRRHRRLYDADMGMNLDDENMAVVCNDSWLFVDQLAAVVQYISLTTPFSDPPA